MALPGGLTLTRAPRRGRGDQGRIARYVKPDQHSLWHIAQGTEALGQVELVGRRVGCVRRPPPRRNEVNYVPSLQPNGLEREKVIPQNMLSVYEELLVLRDARRRCDEGLELSHGGCHFDVQLQDGLVPPDDAHRHPARVSRHVSDQPGGAPKVCFIFRFFCCHLGSGQACKFAALTLPQRAISTLLALMGRAPHLIVVEGGLLEARA